MSVLLKETKKRTYRWLVLVVCLFASLSAIFSYYKLAPVNLSLIEEFSISSSSTGLLIASVAVSIIFLSTPTGALVARYGPKKICLLAFAFSVIGTFIGVNASNLETLLLGRLAEGGGMALIITAAPVLILQWFPPEETGIALGAWKVFFPFGTLLTLNLCAEIGSTYGWRAVWWIGIIFSLAMCVLVMFTKESKQGTSSEKISKKDSSNHSRSALTDLNIWLVALALVLSGVPLVAFLTWGTTYLSTTRGLSIGYASYVVSLCSAGGVLGSVVGGFISDKIRSRKKIYLPAFAVCLFLYSLLPLATNPFLPFVLFALGCAFNSGSTPIIACVSDLCDKKQVSLGMGIVNIANGAILFFGPLTFGLLYSIMESWNSTLNLLALFYILAIVSGLLARNVK